MRFDKGIKKKYRRSIEDAFDTILDKGNDFHREMIETIIDSKMLVCVFPVSRVNASGITGVINGRRTNDRIESEILSLREALEKARSMNVKVKMQGNGYVIKQAPLAGGRWSEDGVLVLNLQG